MSDYIKREDDKKEYYKDYITKGVAQEVVKDVFRVDTITQEVIDTCMKCMTAIKNAPTADVVEVVRCQDCSHGEYSEDVLWCNITDEPMREDDYCSKGDRL